MNRHMEAPLEVHAGKDTVRMQLTKSTKGTYVYGALQDDVAVKTVYVSKRHLPDPPPQQINLTIEEA